MSKVCAICNKGPAFGNSRSHSMVATKRRFNPNLQRVRIMIGATPKRAYVCTRCLKGGKVTKAVWSSNRLGPMGSNPRMEAAQPLSSPLGRITITNDAVAQVVGHTAAECYGVVGMAKRRGARLTKREKPNQGVSVRGDAETGVTIDLYVVVEYGLNLAEVAATVRSRVTYEVERITGLPVRALEVHIEDVRRSEA